MVKLKARKMGGRTNRQNAPISKRMGEIWLIANIYGGFQ